MNILIIDDEIAALKKTELILSEYGKCYTAMTGKNAKDLFLNGIKSDQPFSIIAIDIDLPDLSGLELLKYFTDEEKKRGVVSVKIVITAHGSRNNVIEARRICDAFFIKPIKKELFRTKINEIFSI